MSIVTELELIPDSLEGPAMRDAQVLLEALQEATGADIAALVECRADLQPRGPLAWAGRELPGAERWNRLIRLVREVLHDHAEEDDSTAVLEADALKGTHFRSALITPYVSMGMRLGELLLLAREPDTFTPERMAAAQVPLLALRTLMENAYLKNRVSQNLSTAQSILAAAEMIADNPSPQRVVDILQQTLFGAHITAAAMLIYGPDDGLAGAHEYLELRGTWSRHYGSGVGNGLRIYVKDYLPLLRELEEKRIITLDDVRGEAGASFDPFVRGLLRGERVRSLALLALTTSSRSLGVIAIATHRRHIFSPREIRNYRVVAEFLAISAMADFLREQHDIVQQGRAALLDAVTDGVFMAVPHGKSAQVLTVNQVFTRQFEVSEASVQGKSVAELIELMAVPEPVRQDLREMWLTPHAQDPGVFKGEFHLIDSMGRPIDITWYTAPVYRDGVVLGRIYILHDVSPERTAARLRADFFSRVSHELRTPLTSIQGFAEFILEVTGDQLPDLAREYTEIILQSAKHLKTIFTDMIEISRADTGQIELHKTRAHLPDVIIDAAARLELQYKARKQRLVLDLDDDLPAVQVDVSRIIQVLTNLLSNAIKYSPEGSVIRVHTKYLAAGANLPEGAPPDLVLPAVLVSVVDEGKGLQRDDAERVFVPFFRTDDVKKRKIEGVGLGLAVTRSLVEVHRGKIWAVPVPPATGGCFLFTLPTVRA